MSDKSRKNASESPAEAESTEAAGAAAQTSSVAFPYAAAGAAFTNWFNGRVRRLQNATIRLGAWTATVRELHPDGRLELAPHAAAGEAEEAFIPFEAAHLDQLLLKFAAQGT